MFRLQAAPFSFGVLLESSGFGFWGFLGVLRGVWLRV